MKLLVKISALNLLLTSLIFAQSSNNRYIIFGDSLTDSGSDTSSQLLEKKGEEATRSIVFEGNNLLRNLGNNHWVLGDSLFSKPFQSAPITSFNYADPTVAPKTWVNYLSQEDQKTLVTYRSINNDFNTYLNNSKYNILFAAASAQSGNNFINDIDDYAIETGLFPYVECTDEQYGTVKSLQPPVSCVPSVITQVKRYTSLAKADNFKPDENTKVIIWVGGNDVFGNIMKAFNVTKLDHKKLIAQLKAYHPSRLVKNIRTSVELLKDSGFKSSNIYVFALPNFKYVPAVRQLIEGFSSPVQSTILSILSYVSNNYNNSIKKMALNNGANFFDIGSDLIDIVEHKENYKDYYTEFATDNSLSMCIDTISQPLNNKNMNFPLCEGFIFYNNMHPTTYTHKIIADKFQQYLSTDSTV